MKNKWLVILLAASFIKGLFWLGLTPIFQIPDEPSHFSYVQFLAETGRRPLPRREMVSSQELFVVTKAVGFNWQIEHPVWRQYASNWQETIKSIPAAAKQEFMPNNYLTALKRPGLYYSLASLVYRLLGQADFFWRFFGLRLFSLFIQIIIVWLVFQTAQKLFKKVNLSLAAATAVSFHPGFSFILSGVSYEALGVLAVTLFIYLVAAKAKLIWLVLTAFLGILIKPDLIFLVLLLPLILSKRFRLAAAGMIILSFIGLILINPLINFAVRGQQPWLDKFLYILPLKDYADYANQIWQIIFNPHIFSQSLAYLKIFASVHYHQIFAWYWGVFGWLEKTMPLWVYSVLKVLVLVGVVALIKAKKIKLLVLAVILQAVIIVGNDWLIFLANNEIYGIQGRYFLPAISAQMILLTLGLNRFINYRLIILGAVSLNLIGLYSLWQYFGNAWQF